jgi:hypothetical protein
MNIALMRILKDALLNTHQAGQAGVGMSADAARRSACATIV